MRSLLPRSPLARSPLGHSLRLAAAAGLLAGLAACNAGTRTQTASLEGYTPDPALRSASRNDLTGRVAHACAVTQSRLQKVEEGAVQAPCGCYAQRTLRTLDREEIASYRSTGYFNDTAKAKALDALDSCKLPRPV